MSDFNKKTKISKFDLLLEAINKSEYGFNEPDYIEHLFTELEDNGHLSFSIDCVSSNNNGESFTICTYYNVDLKHSIVLDWDFKIQYDSQIELCENIFRIEKLIEVLDKKTGGKK